MIGNVNLEDPADADNCAVSSVINDAPASFSAGVHTVTWTVIDSAGNMASCSQIVTVLDSIAPELTCPTDAVLFLDASSCEIVSPDIGTPAVGDNCDILSTTNDLIDPLALGIHTITWTSTDTSGNVSTCSQLVEVRDTIAPLITCPSIITISADAGVCSRTAVMLGTPMTSDNCMVQTITNDAPSSFSVGSTIVTWTVTDNSGNTATCTQEVIVTDDELPTITCPSDITTSADTDLCTASGISLGTPLTDDNCSVATVTNDAPMIYPVGTTMVTWTVTDDAGNSATCIQQVTIDDDQAPVVTCLADITLDTDVDMCSAANPGLLTPPSNDNCGVASVASDAPAIFPIGETMVTWTVTDDSGNMATCIQLVTVIDIEPPSITCPVDVTASADPGFCSSTSVNIGSPIVDDNCPSTSISNDAPAVFPLGMTTVTWTITDAAGNINTCTQLITIVDMEDPTITCSGPMTVKVDPGSCMTSSVTLVPPSTDDNCGVASVTNNAPSIYPLGTTMVTWTVTDDSGNQATCLQEVLVEDDQIPVITCPSDTTINCMTSILIADLGVATATDNCMLDTITFVDVIDSTSCDSEFIINRTWRATDASGNSGYCLQVITVQDTIAPVLSAMPADVTVTCLSDVPGDPGITATDNCGEPLTVSYTQSAAPVCVGSGTVTNTWTTTCLLYTSPSPRDQRGSRMPSSA